ncbi:MAG TPA: histidine kinase [Allosphingosinicella sp.]|nr:histidine kinase [Allosphingosinicella sp.]
MPRTTASRRFPTLASAAVLTVAFWTASFLLNEVGDLIDGSARPLLLGLHAVAATVGILICVPLHLLLRHVRRAPWRLIAAVAGIVVAAILYRDFALFLRRVALNEVDPPWDWLWRLYIAVYWGIFFLAWTALHLALGYGQYGRFESERSRRLEALAHDAQLRALRYQIDPHFLFNTLNSMSALVITGRAAQAERMIGRVARYFETTLAIDPLQDVPLETELVLQRAYLEIEAVRSDGLSIRETVSADAAAALVPPLLLQPLVENAIKHGRSSTDGKSVVTIAAEICDRELRLTIENDKAPSARGRPGTGTGLRNTRERLERRYGAAASLRIVDGRSRFAVALRLPYSPGPAVVRAPQVRTIAGPEPLDILRSAAGSEG